MQMLFVIPLKNILESTEQLRHGLKNDQGIVGPFWLRRDTLRYSIILFLKRIIIIFSYQLSPLNR